MIERIREFSRQLQEEFGPLAIGEHACLLEAAEEWGVQLGDELARVVTEQELPAPAESAAEAAVPTVGALEGPAEASHRDAARSDSCLRAGVLLPSLSGVFFSL